MTRTKGFAMTTSEEGVRQFMDTVTSSPMPAAKTEISKSVTAYLAGLVWDGTLRLDRWLVDYAGAEDSVYVRAVSRKMLVAAVRRSRTPGCAFDSLPVLVGFQGCNMSQALRALAVEDDWFIGGLVHLFGSLMESAWEETFSQASAELRGPPRDRWIVEVNELDDAAALKAFLPNCHDAVRAAYARESVLILRQFVIIGTTDKMERLREAPENHRFWPVRIQLFDLVRLRAARDQLWAEAAEAEAIGESILLEDALDHLVSALDATHRVSQPAHDPEDRRA